MALNKILFFSVLEKSKPGVPKVIKRRAPAPISDGPDISISRPIATKVDHSKGMIPPPPLKTPAPAPSTSKSMSPAKSTPTMRPASPKPSSRPVSPIARKSPTPPPPKPLADTINSSYAPQSLNSITGSSESLVKCYAPPSPSASSLLPGRKVTDVTTIKRQPKTGWL